VGCPYIRNKNEVIHTPDGKTVTVTAGGETVCPDCGGTNIAVSSDECKCRGCGFVLCGIIPKC